MVIETNDDGRDGRGLRVETREPTPNPWRGCQSVGTDKRCQSDDSSTTRNEHSPVEGQRLWSPRRARMAAQAEATVAHVERLEGVVGRVATVAVVGCGRRRRRRRRGGLCQLGCAGWRVQYGTVGSQAVGRGTRVGGRRCGAWDGSRRSIGQDIG